MIKTSHALGTIHITNLLSMVTCRLSNAGIARQIIVEKHGGTIEVNSAPGQGAEFVITIPL